MPLRALHIRGYRSLQDVRVPFGRLTVVTGANGTGKSNLYQALRLLSRAARGELARALAEEGGLPSALWSGPVKRTARKAPPIRIALSALTDRFGYELACGLPVPMDLSVFNHDPEVKLEQAWLGDSLYPKNRFMKRDHGHFEARADDNRWAEFPFGLISSESALAQISDPQRYPLLARIRDELAGWRFYHQFRTDSDSPLRTPQIGTRTVSLSDDGRDLAAAIATIREIGDVAQLERAIERLQPGAKVEIETVNAMFSLSLSVPGLRRALSARELSDGTLRYLALTAALLTPRPPPLLAFNEPETSLNPEMIEPLADMITEAASRTQVWITTHSESLVSFLAERAQAKVIKLCVENGATRVVGQGLIFLPDDEDSDREQEEFI